MRFNTPRERLQVNTRRPIAYGLAAALFLGVVAAMGFWASQPRASDRPNTGVVLDRIAGQALDGVSRVVDPAIDRTEKVSDNAELQQALLAGDAESITTLLNEQILNATEVDVMAVFDAQGDILAISNVYPDGRSVPQERVDRVMGKSMRDRPIIESCATNQATGLILEFQTNCDITPAYFDSTGLSVASSAPIRDPHTGKIIGVVSTRLRFDRVLTLISDQPLDQGVGQFYFVTDQGGYFDESINAGQAAHPIPSALLGPMVAQLNQNEASHTYTRVQGQDQPLHVGLYRLSDVTTIDAGGLQLMLAVPESWIMREAKQAALIRTLWVVVLASLTLALSGTLYYSFRSGNHRRAMAQTIDQLHSTEAVRDRTQKKLVDASRRAGMAEVATGVLHNVGNVLNSVTVSAAVLERQTKQIPVDHLQKSVGLIRKHEENLAAFFETHEKGSRLPSFLDKVALSLERERSQMLAEIENLRSRIDHIHHIINIQQDHVALTLVPQLISPREVIEQAIDINDASFVNHQVKVSVDLHAPNEIQADAHMITQVLVNLLSNAKRSLQQTDQQDKEIHVAAWAQDVGGAPGLGISVTDNGVGISPDHLDRIFQHGFTTSPSGHGFGLHISANAARVMGGDLQVSSRGKGHGAAFTLTLPCKMATAEAGSQS